LKIAVIAPPWLPIPPPAYGGTESVVDRLVRGFAARDHDVMVFTTGDATVPVLRRWLYEQAQAYRIGNAACEVRHVVHAYEAARGYDIVHDHTAVGTIVGARVADVPVVTTNHGPFDADAIDLYRHVAPGLAVVAISHHQASTAVGVPIRKVIHHGVEPEHFPVGRGDGGYLLFLGRMSPDKGARQAALVARAAGQPLKIAGKMREPAERAYFEEQVRPLLSSEVEYVGEVGEHDKLQLLGGACALLNPIRWPEPFGLVMIEAMACGTPVLTMPDGAASEIVDDGITGFLCRSHTDMVACAGRIDRLDRAACRAVVEGHFSAGRMVAEHLDLYRDILDEHRGWREPAPPDLVPGRPAG
jgi:glycosyltransferase involved in cell wall biosynthesis